MYSGTVKIGDFKRNKPKVTSNNLYPWTIVIRGNGPGVCYAQHCLTGEKLLAYKFNKMGEGGDFKKAHDLAELSVIHKEN